MLKFIIIMAMKRHPKIENLEIECKKEKIFLYDTLPEEETLIKETLYITDHPEIYQGLSQEGANVLVWSHEENKVDRFINAPYIIENINEIELDYLKKVYRRFQKLPWDITETLRCKIREMTEDDIEDLYRIYEGDTITKYMEGLYEDREKERQFIRSYIENAYEFYGFGTWVIERKEDSRLIGRVGFNMREGYEEPELGFVIAEEFQRQGYAFECCRAVMEVGKKEYDFDRIQTLVQIQNEASLELCKKLGFIWVEEIEYENKAYCRWIKYL